MSQSEKIYAKFILQFQEIMKKMKERDFSDFVFLCIGTDKITGDCFGPLVGYQLKQKLKEKNFIRNILIFGDLEFPVCATNINTTLEKINQICQKPCIIAIDAALAKKEDIGKIYIKQGGMKIGKGVNQKYKEIGDVSIKGIVAKDYKIAKINYEVLQNTPLNIIMKLAENTADGIWNVMQYY